MKTFTNYAEKKAKQFFNLLQGYTKGIRMTAILILLLMGVSNAWAGNNITFQNGANFYFDPYYNATQTVNKGTIQLAVRKYQNTGGDDYGWYTGVTTLTNIENTRLYYASNFEGPSWNDNGLSFHGWAMISNSSAKSNGDTEYWKDNNSTWYSDFKNYGLNNGSTYLFVATSASKGQSIEPNGAGYLSEGYSALNYTQTIKTAVNGADANSKAAITVTSYNLTGNGTISSQKSASISTSSKSTTISDARTATTTLTVGTVATGYQFDGWYAAQTGGTALSTSTTYTYYPTAATTVYARFSAKKYTITYKDQNNTTFSGTHAANYPTKHTYGTATTLKDATKTGYTFDGWHTDAACTNKVTSLGATAYTANITLYAKWTATPTTIYLKPSANWKQANARFAIYAFGGGGDKWVDMTPVGCNDEYYMVDVPAGYSQFKFVRLNPATTENNWDNRWNETGDLTLPSNENNLFDMTWIYLNATSIWDKDNARFAAYFIRDINNTTDGRWMSMESTGTQHVYKCLIPDDAFYDWLSFCRMDGENTTNDWNNKWNQTNDLKMTGSNNDSYKTFGNYFTITDMGSDKSSGEWSWNDIAWTKLDLPTITYNQPANGSVTVTTASGKAITTGSSVEFDTEIIVTVTPNAGYAVNTATITIGGKQQTLYSGENTVTVCGNTSINVSFKQKAEWYIIGIDGNWDLQEKYKFIDGRVYVDLGEKADKTFKIAKASGSSIDNNNQYGNKTFQGHDNSHTLTSANSYGGDATIKMVHNGGHVFVWDEDTKKLTIEYPNVCYLHGEFNDLHEEINDWKDNEAHALHNQVAMVKLELNQEYEFKVADKGVYRTSNAYATPIIGSTTITMDDATAYNGDSRGWHNCTIQATVTGIYRFSYNRETHVLTITYPEGSEPKVNDYRLAYKNSAPGSFHPAHFIRKNTTASEKLDTVSFFVDGTASTPQIILQRCTAVANGVGTWADVGGWQDVAVEAAGVYNFVLKQTNSGDTHNAEIDMSKKHAYTGHYYIRTNCAAGGWEAYNVASSMMTYSSYADKHEKFDHYYCEWVENATENVSFTIANDYSYCVSDTMTTDNIAPYSCLPGQQASVRFGWDSKSNELSRAYLSGSSNISDRFLVLIGDEKLKDSNGNNFNVKDLNSNETNFADLQNWIYQVDVTASKYTYVKLTAKYNNIVQYFHGSQDAGAQLLTSSDESEYKMRIIYDFKTNHLVAAWLGGGNTIEGENRELGAEMMIIRKNQNKAEQLLFNPNTNTLGSVETVYAVTTFTKDFITSDRTQYERALYWVSFPFDVRIGEVFGFGEYGDHWIIQYYDGAARAKYGLFEDSGTYWRYITSTDSVLHQNTGYVLTLDLDKVAQSFLHDATEVSLYFPSTDDLGTITGTLPQSVSVTGHKCEIVMTDATPENKRDRTIYDSHWNMIGVPVFADVNGFLTDPAYVRDGISFYYEYLPATNSYQATNKTADFQTMYGYMVQFAGTINWSSKDVTFNPNQKLAARRNSESELPEKVVLGLELVQGEEKADQTFVQLQQEGATTDFDMNIDLTKIINSGANIYTLTNDRIQAAGNALPMEEAIVPVGVQIAAEGEYTFRMPDGTEGMVVELVDYETNTRTNLLLSDYIVTLSKGTSENRFALHIQPQKDVVTSLENIGEGVNNGEAVNKYLIDGKLIIRTAEGVFDAQGKRL